MASVSSIGSSRLARDVLNHIMGSHRERVTSTTQSEPQQQQQQFEIIHFQLQPGSAEIIEPPQMPVLEEDVSEDDVLEDDVLEDDELAGIPNQKSKPGNNPTETSVALNGKNAPRNAVDAVVNGVANNEYDDLLINTEGEPSALTLCAATCIKNFKLYHSHFMDNQELREYVDDMVINCYDHYINGTLAKDTVVYQFYRLYVEQAAAAVADCFNYLKSADQKKKFEQKLKLALQQNVKAITL